MSLISDALTMTAAADYVLPRSVTYYDYATTIWENNENGNGGRYVDIPEHTIVEMYYSYSYENGVSSYHYGYKHYQLLISDIGTASERIYAIKNLDTEETIQILWSDDMGAGLLENALQISGKSAEKYPETVTYNNATSAIIEQYSSGKTNVIELTLTDKGTPNEQVTAITFVNDEMKTITFSGFLIG